MEEEKWRSIDALHNPPTCMNVQLVECVAHFCLQDCLQQSCSGLKQKRNRRKSKEGGGDEYKVDSLKPLVLGIMPTLHLVIKMAHGFLYHVKSIYITWSWYITGYMQCVTSTVLSF